jgi:hypothetical protein
VHHDAHSKQSLWGACSSNGELQRNFVCGHCFFGGPDKSKPPI